MERYYRTKYQVYERDENGFGVEIAYMGAIPAFGYAPIDRLLALANRPSAEQVEKLVAAAEEAYRRLRWGKRHIKSYAHIADTPHQSASAIEQWRKIQDFLPVLHAALAPFKEVEL